MITGKQIREARALLGLHMWKLAQKANCALSTIQRAESVEGEPPITIALASKIEAALQAAGIEFTPKNGGKAGVRLRKPGGEG